MSETEQSPPDEIAQPVMETPAEKRRRMATVRKQRQRMRERGELPPLRPDETDAERALRKGAAKRSAKATGPKAQRSDAYPLEPAYQRPKGWLRVFLEGQTDVLPTGTLRDLAKQIVQKDGLIFAQELLADPKAKDTDKRGVLRDLAAVSVGFITPDMVGGEDAPQLPPPIVQVTDGELPPPDYGEGATSDDAVAAENAEGDGGAPVIEHAVAAGGSGGGGPIPHIGAA